MFKILKGKFDSGIIRLLEEYPIKEGRDVLIMVEEGEESILDKTFGIWIDEPEYLEKLRMESEKRLRIGESS